MTLAFVPVLSTVAAAAQASAQENNGVPWPVLLTMLCTLMLAAIGWLIALMYSFKSELKEKLDKSECEKTSRACKTNLTVRIDKLETREDRIEESKTRSHEDIYKAINTHSHAPDGRVIRGT